MEALADLASSLLLFAKQVFGPGVCPGEWVWATTTAGALIALSPTLGAFLVALVRKGTGNRYNGVTVTVFGAIGVVSVLLLPLLFMSGISALLRTTFAAAYAGGSGGLTGTDVDTIRTTYCFVGEQLIYLGGKQNIFDTLFYPGENVLAYGFYLGALVGLPVLALIFVMLQAKLAFRRGPLWPCRFFWVSFLALMVLTAGVSANTAIHLWLGFLPVVVLGLVPIAMVGPPRWTVIRKSDQPRQPRRDPEPARPRAPLSQYPPTAVAQAQPDPVPALPPLPMGRTGGSRYKRLRRLGHGGFGTVWSAIDTQLDRKVALKIAHAPDVDTEKRMHREARALAALDHPNCVRVYDLVEEPDGLALVMEYLEGQALAFAVDATGPLDDVAAARLWSTMAGALQAAHDKGVLHRDVKPSNVIVDPRGIPHLIDFGIARSKGDAALTATGMMLGTPDYTAPETANGAAATPASDAWQLAATVSYALTGEPPRGERENPMAALMAAARAESPKHMPTQSAHADLLTAALSAEPRDRPTLRAVIDAMDSWLAGAGQSGEGPVTRILPGGDT